MSDGTDEQPLMVRWARDKKGVNRQKLITRREVNRIVKVSAREAGLKAEHFSSKSFRIGVASTDGMCDADKDAVAGWSHKGKTREEVYDQRPKSGRLAGDSKGHEESFGLAGLKRKSSWI